LIRKRTNTQSRSSTAPFKR